MTQTWQNPHPEPIYAVYTYPLSHQAAVCQMDLVIGDREISAISMERESARREYEAAVKQGTTASLLEQERPNIFTQSLGNLMPGETVQITISMIDEIERIDGEYRFQLPMTVGPRYIPGTNTGGRSGTGVSVDTDVVPDASRITPGGPPAGLHAQLSLTLDAGLPIQAWRSVNHEMVSNHVGPGRLHLRFADGGVVPDADVEIRYRLAGETVQAAVTMTAADDDSGHVLLMVEPDPLQRDLASRQPRDLVFLVDVSGSMSGAPIDQAKAAMRAFCDGMTEDDRLRVIAFAGASMELTNGWTKATGDNLQTVMAALSQRHASGGTEMLSAFTLALSEPVDADRERLVVLLSDGFIGDEARILSAVANHQASGSRFCALGIGSNVNRYLINGIGRLGGGLAEVLSTADDAKVNVRSMLARMGSPQLRQCRIVWPGVTLEDVQPARLPDLYPGSPLVVVARYQGTPTGQPRLEGVLDGQAKSYPVSVTAVTEQDPDVLPTVWARRQIRFLEDGSLRGSDRESAKQSIISVATAHNLMSRYTSLVAVDLTAVADAKPDAKPVLPPASVATPRDGGPVAFMAMGGAASYGAGAGSAGAFGQRQGGARKVALGRFGGSRSSESTAEAGLRWLVAYLNETTTSPEQQPSAWRTTCTDARYR